MKSSLRRIFRLLAEIVVAVYLLLDAIVSPIVRPTLRFFGELRIVAQLRSWIERLGPYPSLALLLVPVAFVEPAKLGALYLIGLGHVVSGTALLILAQILSVLLVERLFVIVKPRLLELAWFARLWGWFVAIRDPALRWLLTRAAWILRLRILAKVRMARLLSRLGRARRSGDAAP